MTRARGHVLEHQSTQSTGAVEVFDAQVKDHNEEQSSQSHMNSIAVVAVADEHQSTQSTGVVAVFDEHVRGHNAEPSSQSQMSSIAVAAAAKAASHYHRIMDKRLVIGCEDLNETLVGTEEEIISNIIRHGLPTLHLGAAMKALHEGAS